MLKNCQSTLTLKAKAGGGVDADYGEVQPEDRAALKPSLPKCDSLEQR